MGFPMQPGHVMSGHMMVPMPYPGSDQGVGQQQPRSVRTQRTTVPQGPLPLPLPQGALLLPAQAAGGGQVDMPMVAIHVGGWWMQVKQGCKETGQSDAAVLCLPSALHVTSALPAKISAQYAQLYQIVPLISASRLTECQNIAALMC